MNRPGKTPPRFNGIAFISAAAIAPGISLAIFYLSAAVVEQPTVPGDIGSFLFLQLLVSVWGLVPSLAFGGLVMALIRRVPWRGQPATAVFMLGGVAAAGLYVLAGLGAAELSPGAALFFAPWAPDLGAPGGIDPDWWVVASLLLAGAGAGLIYGMCVKRG